LAGKQKEYAAVREGGDQAFPVTVFGRGNDCVILFTTYQIS